MIQKVFWDWSSADPVATSNANSEPRFMCHECPCEGGFRQFSSLKAFLRTSGPSMVFVARLEFSPALMGSARYAVQSFRTGCASSHTFLILGAPSVGMHVFKVVLNPSLPMRSIGLTHSTEPQGLRRGGPATPMSSRAGPPDEQTAVWLAVS